MSNHKNRRFQRHRSPDDRRIIDLDKSPSFSTYSEHDDRTDRPSAIYTGSGNIFRLKGNQRFGRGQNARNFGQKSSWNKLCENLDAAKLLDDCDLDLVSAVSSLGDLSIGDVKDTRDKKLSGRIVKEQRNGPPSFQRSVKDRIGPKLNRNYAWYKITVLRGALMEKHSLLQHLVSVMSPSTSKIDPYSYKVGGQDVTFYVDNYQSAFNLGNASGRITDREGEKITIQVKEAMPDVILKKSDEETIKSVFLKRYNPASKALDLSKFHDDPSFRACDFFVPLSRPSVLFDVIKIIGKTIPDLHALNLSQNKIFSFPTSPVLEHLEHLKVLNLSGNKLYHITHFKVLKNLGIEELFLQGTHISSNYSRYSEESQKAFQKELQKIFPKLLRFDGIDLPPVISFDTGTPVKLRPAQASFFCDTTHQELVKQFVREYFQIYDSDNRAPLMEAYDISAQFSLTCCLPSHSSSLAERNPTFSNGKVEDYTLISRNLRKIRTSHQRIQKLYLGKESIVSCLCNLPKTQHDPRSFTVDLTISTPNLVMLTINGIYRERPNVSVPVIRFFSRVFVVAISNGRCCIINELCSVSKPTNSQAKIAFKSEPVAGPSSSSLPALMPPTPTSPEADLEAKRQLVLQISRFTGMNLAYSERCLVETSWNYDAALIAFNNHRASLPPEAFIGEGTVVPRFEH